MAQLSAGPDGAGSHRHRARRDGEGQFRPNAPSRGSPEGQFVSGPGKALIRHLTAIIDQGANAAVRLTQAEAALTRIWAVVEARKARHRGGDRAWLLRLLIPVAMVAEGVTAYIGMEVLVSTRSLAVGLAGLAALVGGGMAGVLANRRLNGLPVPIAARILEGIFVVVLTLLRYDSLYIQGANLVAAAASAGLAALISALGLLGIEEILVETQTFGMFLSKIQSAWRQWRCTRAATRMDMIQAHVEASADKLEQQFVDFLLKEGTSVEQAQRRATALRCALTSSGPAT